MTFSRLVIIDTRVIDYNKFIDSLRAGVAYVLLDYYSDTFESLTNKILALQSETPLESVALVSHGEFGSTYKLLDSAQECRLSDVESADRNLDSWNQFRDFFVSLCVPVIDLLGCALYMNDNWKYVLNTLETQMAVNFRASVDDTGALALGGNWILESDNVNIKDVYFTELIEGWSGLLTSPQVTYTAIIDASGRLYTCGNNSNGRLGIGVTGTTFNQNRFTLVSSISNEIVTQVSTANACACITASGKLYTWGSNSDGQLGIGSSSVSFNTPQLVTDLIDRKIVFVKAGNIAMVCLDSSGYIYSAGKDTYINRSTTDICNNRFGRIVGGSTSISSEIITQIDSNGVTFGAVSSTTNNLYMWGERSGGMMGSSSTTTVGSTLSPNVVLVSSNAKKCIIGDNHAGFITKDDKLIVFGSNNNYQIRSSGSGTGTTTSQVYYHDNSGADFGTDIADVKFGYRNTYIIKKNGTIYFSGLNANGWAGFGDSNLTSPITTPTLLSVNAISINPRLVGSLNSTEIYTQFIDTNNNLKVIGKNTNGLLGTGNSTDVSGTLMDVSAVRDISGGSLIYGRKFVSLADSDPLSISVSQKITPVINTSTKVDISFGQNITTSNISITMKDPNTPDILQGTFTYSPALPITKPNAGTQNITVTFTPQNDASYNSTTVPISILVNKSDISNLGVVVSATDISFGRTLASSSLSYTGTYKNPIDGSTVTGSLSFVDPTIKPSSATSSSQQYRFIADASNNYNNLSGLTVNVNTTKTTPVLSNLSATSIVINSTLGTSTVSGTATNPWDNTSVTGTFSFTNQSAVATGSAKYSVTFTPQNSTNFNSVVTSDADGAQLIVTQSNQSSFTDADISINNLTGEISWRSDLPTGTYTIDVLASNGAGQEPAQFILTISPAGTLTISSFSYVGSNVNYRSSTDTVFTNNITTNVTDLSYVITSKSPSDLPVSLNSSNNAVISKTIKFAKNNSFSVRAFSVAYPDVSAIATTTFDVVASMNYNPASSNVVYGQNYNSVQPSFPNFSNTTGITYSISGEISGVSIDNTGILTAIASRQANYIKTGTQNVIVRATDSSGLNISTNYTFNVADPSISYSNNSMTTIIGTTASNTGFSITNFTGTATDLSYNITKSPSDVYSGITIGSNGILQINTTRSGVTVPVTGLDTSYNVTVTANYGSVFSKSTTYKFIINKPVFTYDNYGYNYDITYGMTSTGIESPTITNFNNISDASFSFYTDYSGITLDNIGTLTVNTTKTARNTPLSASTRLDIRARYGNYFDLSRSYTLNLLAPTISYNNITMNFGESKSSSNNLINFGDDAVSSIAFSLIETNKDLSGTSINSNGDFIIDTSTPDIKRIRTDYADSKGFKVRAQYGNLFDISNTLNVTIAAVDPSGMIYQLNGNTINNSNKFVAVQGTSYTASNKPRIVFTDTTGGAPLQFTITNRQKTA